MTESANLDSLQSRTVEWLRYPLMVLIVIIHTDTTLLNSMPHAGISSVLYYILRTIIRLALPMFFIISGYWFFRQPETFTLDAYLHKLKKRARTLLVPYLFWNLFAWALNVINAVQHGYYQKALPDIDIFFGFGAGYCGMPGAFQLWFLRDLMVVCLLSPLLYLLLRGRRPWVLLLFAALYIMPWPAGWHPILMRSPSALLFFSIGAYLGIHKMNMVETVRRVPLWLSLSVPTLVMVCHVWLNMIHSPLYIYTEKLFRIVAVVPTLQVAAMLVERKNVQPIGWLSGSTFLLFATHPLVMNYLLVQPIGDSLAPTQCHFWLVLAAEVLLSIAVCALVHAICSRLLPRTAAFLTGGRAKRQS